MSERNLMVRTHSKLVLLRLWASQVTGNMGLSAHAASTIGSLTCRSIRGKMTEDENLRKKA